MTDQYDYDPVPLNPPEPASDETLIAQSVAHFEFMRQRRTVRAFSDQSIPREVIEQCIRIAGSAPSGANHQPWHFVCVSDPDIKRQIREAAEAEERAFYEGRAGETWLDDLKPIGTDASKPFLEAAPWLIAVFAERYGVDAEGKRHKHYYVPESVGIATGFLINACHLLGLATLTHTPNPMKFLNRILGRPANERPYVLLVVGHPSREAEVPRAAMRKKPLDQIGTFK